MRVGASSALCLVAFAIVVAVPASYPEVQFPEGKRFAFTIVDDTDGATLESVRPVYEFLTEQGLRTTKTVWVLPGTEQELWANRGESLADPDYRAFIQSLQARGFEIASHGARGGTSSRAEILAAMEEYRGHLGAYPRIHVNHAMNRDNLYWGARRLTFPPYRWLYALLPGRPSFDGENPESDRFWGDFIEANVDYVVDFSFFNINLWKVNPAIPYHVSEKQYVATWFNTSNGGDVSSFNDLLSRENLDRLEAEGGVSIVYTHFAKGFYQDGELNTEFAERIRDLASRPGWFVPASTVLDFLKSQREDGPGLSWRQKLRLETVWLIDVLRFGSS